MFYIDLWGFTNDPLYLVYNSAEQENPVSPISTFRDLYRVKLTWDFWSVTFSSGGTAWALEAHLEGPEAQTSPGGAPRHVGRTTCPLSAVDRPIHLILSRTDVF